MSTQHRHNPRLNGSAVALKSRDLCRQGRDCPPHGWACPVLMKLDPQSVAWTCKRCGAIVRTPVGAPRPRAFSPAD